MNTVSPSNVCVYIRYKANKLVEAKFTYLIQSSYVHALKVHHKRE